MGPGYILPVLFLENLTITRSTSTSFRGITSSTHPRQTPGITSNTPLLALSFPISANPTGVNFLGNPRNSSPALRLLCHYPAPISSLLPWSFYPRRASIPAAQQCAWVTSVLIQLLRWLIITSQG